MKFNREDVFKFLKTPKWREREMNDPLSVLGKKVPSSHCKGKREKVLSYLHRDFTSRCDCGFIIEREVGSSFVRYCESPCSKKWLKEYLNKPELKETMAVLSRMPARRTRRIKNFADLCMHGRIYPEDVPLVSEEARQSMKVNPEEIFGWDQCPWLLDEYEEWLEKKDKGKNKKRGK